MDDVFFVSMEGRRDFYIGDFLVREDIPLPVLSENNRFSYDDITPENIIMGMVRVLKDDPENEHIDYYRSFIYTVKPDIDAILTNAAFEAENNEDFKDAIDIYRALLALNKDSIDHLINIAVCYDHYSLYLYEKGIEKDAELMEDIAYKYFKELDEREDKNDSAYYFLGRFYLARENYDKAIEYFKEFISITDDKERKDEVIKAIEELNNIGMFDPDYRSSYDLIQADKDQDALGYINRYIEKYPKIWNGYYLKGIILKKIEDFNNAIVEFKKGLEYNDKRSELYNELGNCYTEIKDFKNAIINYQKALRYSGEDLSIYYNIAFMYMKKGEYEEAKRYCKVILSIDENDLKTKDLLEYINNLEVNNVL